MSYLDQFAYTARCKCGHIRGDHSLHGCAYQHDYGFDATGAWHFTACSRFELAEDDR